MSITQTTPGNRSDELLEVLSDFDQCLIVTHDNPDPDAIAAGWAVYRLVEERLKKPVRLAGGGAIVRAENRHMVELLSPPIRLVTELPLSDKTATILVDCGVGKANHLVNRAGIQPVAVIDHHLDVTGKVNVLFSDIRTDAAASASIAANYLREQKIEPGKELATAVIYALRTETCGGESYHSPLDQSIVNWLTDSADPALLAEIENAPLDPEYYSDLALAMQKTFVYGETALCFLPRASGAEVVGEVADLLVRCIGIGRVLCAVIVGEDLLLSVRTMTDSGNAAQLLEETLDGLGGCGGHTHRAGGKIPLTANHIKIPEQLREDLRNRWLDACQVKQRRGHRLIPRKEIVENL